jgi:hypothetical protein
MGETNPVERKTGGGIRALLVILTAAFFVWAMCGHRYGLDGTPYHRWVWRNVLGQWRYAFFLVLAVPFFLGQWVYWRRPEWVGAALCLVMVSSLGLMIAFAVVQRKPASFDGIVDVIQSPVHGGYFYVAERFLEKGITARQWLGDYPHWLPTFTIHPDIKPPGPVLFFSFLIALLGSGRNAMLTGGLATGSIAVFSVPAVYAFVKYLTARQDGAFAGASYFALSPSLLLLFPQFDQWYPIVTAALVILWARMLGQNSARLAAELGVLMGMVLFFTYLPAVLVFFLVGYTLLGRREFGSLTWPRIGYLCGVAAVALAAFYAVLWAATGFNPIATFMVCWADQKNNLRILESFGSVPRRWPGTIGGDFYDFALGTGWIGYLILGFYLLSAMKSGSRRQLPTAMLCIGQIAMVGLLGLIRCETARVWTFMLPMLMLPVGLELARWEFRWRTTVFAALFILMVAMWHSMTFFP